MTQMPPFSASRDLPPFLRWTTAELFDRSDTIGRQQLVARQSTYPDVAIIVALQSGSPLALGLAAEAILQWKQLQGAQDALLNRFIATATDPSGARPREDARHFAKSACHCIPPRRSSCPCRKLNLTSKIENRAMLLRDERSCQAHCLDRRRSVSVAGSAPGGTLDVAAADKRSAANRS
jgi:hypothetical protein